MNLAAARKGLMAPQNNFLEKISKRFKGQRKWQELCKDIQYDSITTQYSIKKFPIRPSFYTTTSDH